MTSLGPFLVGIVTHTPLYVWAIFAFILFMGYQRTRDRVVHVWRLLLLPAVMIVTAMSGIIGGGLAILPAILAGFVVGGTGGWLLERDGATRRLPGGKLWLRGEWWSLLQIVLIFGFRYSLAVTTAINPAFVGDPTVHLVTAFISSLLSALVLGRTVARLGVFFTTSPAAA